MHLWQKTWDGNTWSKWKDLGGTVYGDPSAVSWGKDRIDMFYASKVSQVMHRWWDGSNWSSEENIGGLTLDGIGASSGTPGRLDCFVKGSDSQIWHTWYV
jgi:hypothetical protein